MSDEPTPLNIADELLHRPVVVCTLDEASPCDQTPNFPVGAWCDVCLGRAAAEALRKAEARHLGRRLNAARRITPGPPIGGNDE